MLKTKEEISAWLDQYGVKDYTINDDMTVNACGVFLQERGLEKIEVQFKKVSADFNCSNNSLTSLEGCPEIVGGSFHCGLNKLTNLDFCPKEVNCDFDCRQNKLTDLKHCPEEIGGSFHCSKNELTSLEGSPKKVVEGFNCLGNKLTNLIGCPEEVGGDFNCRYNQLQLIILEALPKRVRGNFYCGDNKELGYLQKITRFEYFEKYKSNYELKSELHKRLDIKEISSKKLKV